MASLFMAYLWAQEAFKKRVQRCSPLTRSGKFIPTYPQEKMTFIVTSGGSGYCRRGGAVSHEDVRRLRARPANWRHQAGAMGIGLF